MRRPFPGIASAQWEGHNNLFRPELQWAECRRRFSIGELLQPLEISQLHMALRVYEDVVRLEVTIHNTSHVKVIKGE
jgi:hypothetical protein